jgi:hypothetical protein
VNDCLLKKNLILAFVLEGLGFTGYIGLGDKIAEVAGKFPQIPLIYAAFILPLWIFLGLFFAGLLFKLARVLRQRARRAQQRLAGEVTISDTRPPVLFLRTFGDDQVSLAHLKLPL